MKNMSFLRITSETPGQAVVMEGTRPEVSRTAILELAIALTLIVVGYFWMGPSYWDRWPDVGPDSSFIRMGAVVFLLVFLGALLHACYLIMRARAILSLAVDSSASSMHVVECGVFGWMRREWRIALSDLAGATLWAELMQERKEDALLRLTLAVTDKNGAHPHEIQISVLGVNRSEEVADLAFRLGAAACFRAHRVVRNDAFNVEIALTKGEENGDSPLPVLNERAQYAQDIVCAAARSAVAEERIAPFDPKTLTGPFRAVAWEPGRRVRLHRRPGPGLIGGALFVLIAAGFFAMAYGGAVNADVPEEAWIGALLFGLFGASLLGYGLWLAHAALPCDVVFDWDRRTILVRRRLRRTTIHFATVEALEMRSQAETRTSKNNRRNTYWRCCLTVRHRALEVDGSNQTDLAESAEFENPADPQRQMLPLVTDLANAMNVKRLVA
ncbi:MAG: hypothetical protein JXO72_01170 [Vicinamibacteria bacterium]|nr:hypothetical protein [Vicinamibacteria bacterium]